MKRYQDLTHKEVRIWKSYVREQLGFRGKCPHNLAESTWREMRSTHTEQYSVKNAFVGSTPKELDPPDEHRTVVENLTRDYRQQSTYFI